MQTVSKRCYRRAGALLLLAAVVGGLAHTMIGPGGTDTTMVGAAPVALAVDGRRGLAYVVNNGDNTLSVLDTRQRHLRQALVVGLNPYAVAVDAPSGHVFVVNHGDPNSATPGSVSVLSASGALVRVTRVGIWPESIAVDEAARRVFVGSFGSNTVSVLDAGSGALLDTLTAGTRAGGITQIAVDQRSSRLYVLTFPDLQAFRAGHGRLLTFDARTGVLLHGAPVGPRPGQLAVDEAAGRVFVHNSGDYVGQRSSVTVLDSRSGRLIRTVPVGGDGALVVDEPTGRVFVSAVLGLSPGPLTPMTRNIMRVLDAHSGSLTRALSVGPWTMPLAADQHTGRLLVAAYDGPLPGQNARLSLLDGWTGAMMRTIALPSAPFLAMVDGQRGQAFVLDRGLSPPSLRPWLLQWLRQQMSWGASSPAQNRRPSLGSVRIIDLRDGH